MNPKGRSRSNPQSDYTGIGNEFEKDMQEYEMPFKEFEYQMNGIDRLETEFEELMKIPELEEYEKDFENGFPFPDDPRRYKRHMDMLIRSCGITPEEFFKYINKRIRKSKSLDLSDY